MSRANESSVPVPSILGPSCSACPLLYDRRLFPLGLPSLPRACSLSPPPWFAAGIRSFVVLPRRSGAAGFEDGTPNFLALPALRHGFSRLRELGGFAAIRSHTNSLAVHLVGASAPRGKQRRTWTGRSGPDRAEGGRGWRLMEEGEGWG